MLESMRKHMNWLMWFVVIVITVTFLFFGLSPAGVGSGNVAKVGDYGITADEYNKVYRNMYDTYRQLLKDQFNESMAKELKTQALRDLITTQLLIQEAERRGLKISDAELQAVIVKIPDFSRDGKFDKRTYERVLDTMDMKPAVFEEKQRESLLRQKMQQLITDSVMIPDIELAAVYKQRNPKAKSGDFEKNKQNIHQMYLREKQRDELLAYVRVLYNKTLVTINEKALGS